MFTPTNALQKARANIDPNAVETPKALTIVRMIEMPNKITGGIASGAATVANRILADPVTLMLYPRWPVNAV